MFFLMDHHSLMFCSGYAIFKIYFHKISKNTALKGILPHFQGMSFAFNVKKKVKKYIKQLNKTHII